MWPLPNPWDLNHHTTWAGPNTLAGASGWIRGAGRGGSREEGGETSKQGRLAAGAQSQVSWLCFCGGRSGAWYLAAVSLHGGRRRGNSGVSLLRGLHQTCVQAPISLSSGVRGQDSSRGLGERHSSHPSTLHSGDRVPAAPLPRAKKSCRGLGEGTLCPGETMGAATEPRHPLV